MQECLPQPVEVPRAMANRGSTVIAVFLVGALLVPHVAAQGGCYQGCSSNNECLGKLACMQGKCNDDPGVGTHICSNAPPAPSGGGATCQPSGVIISPTITPGMCTTQHMSDCCKSGHRYKKYTCSPPVTAATKATLTVNGFGQGQDGGGAASCTNKFYSASDKVIALSTGWFKGGARCGKTIRIHGSNGKSTTATVVDECDSRAGCDKMHAYQPPCPTNIVDASEAVWHALGVSPNQGSLDVTWSQID